MRSFTRTWDLWPALKAFAAAFLEVSEVWVQPWRSDHRCFWSVWQLPSLVLIYRDSVAFIILILVLIIRPNGLFGKKGITKGIRHSDETWRIEMMKKDNNTLLSSFEQFTSKNAKILWGVLAVIPLVLPFVVRTSIFCDCCCENRMLCHSGTWSEYPDRIYRTGISGTCRLCCNRCLYSSSGCNVGMVLLPGYVGRYVGSCSDRRISWTAYLYV